MCGRYRIPRLTDLIRQGIVPPVLFEEFSEKGLGLTEPRYNVAPSQGVPIVRSDGDTRSLSFARWGLIPFWAKSKPKFQPTNARAETVATGPMFRDAYNRRRCLIPADGFYEWKKLGDGSKQPYHIQMRGGGTFCFAGLWESWFDGSADVETCTIITTEPNTLMSELHDRMPVIVHAPDYDRWMDPRILGVDVAGLLRPFNAGAMEAWPVSTRVNSYKNQGPELIERA